MSCFFLFLNNLCNTAGNRLKALTRIRKSLSQKQSKRLSEVYIMLTFRCRFPMWMFCFKTENESINNIHKRTLQLICDTGDATFEDILERNKPQTIHEVIYTSNFKV